MAPIGLVIIVLGGFALYVLPMAFAAGGAAVGVGAIVVGLAVCAVVMTGLWIHARMTTKPAEPLRAVDDGFEPWKAPQGYRG